MHPFQENTKTSCSAPALRATSLNQVMQVIILWCNRRLPLHLRCCCRDLLPKSSGPAPVENGRSPSSAGKSGTRGQPSLSNTSRPSAAVPTSGAPVKQACAAKKVASGGTTALDAAVPEQGSSAPACKQVQVPAAKLPTDMVTGAGSPSGKQHEEAGTSDPSDTQVNPQRARSKSTSKSEPKSAKDGLHQPSTCAHCCIHCV